MKRIFASFENIKPLRDVKNTFAFPKITKTQYESIKDACVNFCNKIIEEIKISKKSEDFSFMSPKEHLANLNIVSKFGDWLGPVIEKDGKYYRCIKKESIDRFGIFWKSGVLEVFSKRGYIPKLTISQYYSDDYPVIIEQESLEITNITKLPLVQSKKGLLFVSILQYICKKMGFALIDPHYYNYTFFKNHFVYFDLGSFSTIDDYFKYRDFSMVVLGAYRILFSYFPNSVLSKQELGDFRNGIDVSYKTDYFEFVFYKKAALKYCKMHCTKSILNAFDDIFNKYECLPWNVITCFLPERKDDVNELLEEIM